MNSAAVPSLCFGDLEKDQKVNKMRAIKSKSDNYNYAFSSNWVKKSLFGNKTFAIIGLADSKLPPKQTANNVTTTRKISTIDNYS